jgi:hypothetical protein
MTVQLENSGRDTITVPFLNVTNSGGSGDANSTINQLQLEPGEVDTITFPDNGPNANLSRVISGQFVPGDHTFDLEGSYYSTRAGDEYERPLDGQIRTVAAE